MNKNQLETDLRNLKDSLGQMLHKLESDKTMKRTPDVDVMIESLVNLQREVVKVASHQDMSI